MKGYLKMKNWYRGLEKDTKEWVEGYYAQREYIYYETNEKDENKKIVEQECILRKKEGGFEINDIIQGTSGQYIGIQDKNGKYIFEQDILKIIVPETEGCVVGVVQYSTEESCFGISYGGVFFGLNEYCTNKILEVIGNIYEDNDLLEKIKKIQEEAGALTEAIEHAEIIASEAENCECKKEHQQLAEWLKELEMYRANVCENKI